MSQEYRPPIIYPPEAYCLTEKAIARFEAKIMPVTETGCWLWTGSVTGKGYGTFGNKTGHTVRAHRYAYTLYKGPIPEGKVIDHKCRVRSCVNPDHMEAVSMYENTMRGETIPVAHAAKTHCPSGHPYSGDNLYYNKAGARRCRECHRIKCKERQRRKRGNLNPRKYLRRKPV